MPDYFKYNPLRIYTKKGANLNLICVDHVTTLATSLIRNLETINQVFHLTNPFPNNIEESIRNIGIVFNINIEPVYDRQELGPIDYLLDAEEDVFRSYLDAIQYFSCDKTYDMTGFDRALVRLTKEREAQIMKNVQRKFNNDKRVQRNRTRSITHKFERKTLEIGAQALEYYIMGSGPTLVIVNAYGQSLAFWDKITTSLVKDFRVIIWSMRGTSSQKGGMDQFYPIRVHAQDIKCILDIESIEKCHLLGWCTGPKIALEFYSRYPERVESMLFLSSCFKGVREFERFHTSYENDMQEICSRVDQRPEIMPFVINTIKRVLAGSQDAGAYDELTDENKRSLVHEIISMVSKDVRPMVIEPFLSEQSALNYARQLLLFWEKDVTEQLEGLQVPVLMLAGKEDKIASFKMTEAVAELSSRSRSLIVKGGSHYLHYDNSDLVREIIGQFIREGDEFDFKHGLVQLSMPVSQSN